MGNLLRDEDLEDEDLDDEDQDDEDQETEKEVTRYEMRSAIFAAKGGMTVMDLPEDFREWGGQIEQQFIQEVSDRAHDFQAAQKKLGIEVSITDSVHRVIKKINPAHRSGFDNDLRERDRQIALQFSLAVADRAHDFQAAQKELGIEVSTTEAVHHAIKSMNER